MSDYVIEYKNDFPFILYAAMEISTNSRTPVISRTDYQDCTIEFIRSGAGTLEINGKSFYIRENSVYFLTRGSSHSYWPDRNDPWYKLFFVVGGEIMDMLLQAYRLDEVYHIPDCPELKKYFESMMMISNHSENSNRQAAVLFHQFAEEASRSYYGLKTKYPEVIEYLKLQLDDAVEKNFRLEDFARTHHVSEAHLIRMFYNFFKVTPYDYLMNQKMETARRLLLYSPLSVKEIAARLAFSDQYYFSNYFKKRTGTSPREFRLRFQQNEK
ncbi:MAG: AraC family transcriptional regulator [Lentisphaeria bacterium]|nr:AraC family transcriptional regulator [Lentisphaeria bacterium]